MINCISGSNHICDPFLMPSLLCLLCNLSPKSCPVYLEQTSGIIYGKASNPCNNCLELLEKYTKFIEKVYLRRCYDDNEIISSRIVMIMQQKINCNHSYFDVCREYSLEVTVIIDLELTIEKSARTYYQQFQSQSHCR